MIGSILISFALAANLFAAIHFSLAIKDAAGHTRQARLFYIGGTTLTVAAALLFLYSIISHHYEYRYIYEYSSGKLPFGLLVSSFYAGQEGSFFLWALFASTTGLILLKNCRNDFEAPIMAVYSVITASLLLMISPLLKNPFAYVYSEDTFLLVKNLNSSLLSLPFLSKFAFNDNATGQTFIKINYELKALLEQNGVAVRDFIIQGKGLNPILQNFWMQIHPPVLFAGFALTAVPYAFAMAALIKNEYTEWISCMRPWLITSAGILGAALILGGYWAYGVLGWGGYWSWDPVENASLVPWLISIALIHVVVIRKNENSPLPGLILSILIFIFVLYSTFLTRSGILGNASVHSFTDPGRTVYIFLIILLLAGILPPAYLIIKNFYRLKRTEPESAKLKFSDPNTVLWGAVISILLLAFIVLLGTSAPLFGVSVQQNFYLQMSLPLGAAISLFLFLDRWISSAAISLPDRVPGMLYSFFIFLFPSSVARQPGVWAPPLLALLIAIMAFISGMRNVFQIAMLFFLSAAFIVDARIIVKKLIERKFAVGSQLSHAGIALFLAGAVMNSAFSSRAAAELPKLITKEVSGYSLTYKGYEFFDNSNKYYFRIDAKKNGYSESAYPAMYVSEFNGSIMREPHIVSRFPGDIYFEPLGFEDAAKEYIYTLSKDHPADYEGTRILLTGFDFRKCDMDSMSAGKPFRIGAKLSVVYKSNSYPCELFMSVDNAVRSYSSATIKEAGLCLKLKKLEAGGRIEISLSDLNSRPGGATEVLSVDVSINPFINLIWSGAVIAFAGFAISVFYMTAGKTRKGKLY